MRRVILGLVNKHCELLPPGQRVSQHVIQFKMMPEEILNKTNLFPFVRITIH